MLTKLEEIALVARCAAVDDRRAFERLVEAYSPGLHSFIFNLTMGDAALTDDIAQETFLKAYTSIRSFRGLSRFRTWLYRIAVNEYYSWARRRREERLTPSDEPPETECSRPHNLTDMRHDVAVAMKALNDTERTLILLFYFDDLPIKEIVKITGLPDGTVKSYLSRAKAKMAKILNEQK